MLLRNNKYFKGANLNRVSASFRFAAGSFRDCLKKKNIISKTFIAYLQIIEKLPKKNFSG
jgi:hypothetical protein